MWVATQDLPRSAAHPFYTRLNEILDKADFDGYVESLCQRFYADEIGRPGLPPGRYFRMLLLGYFEGLDSERAIAWRAADSLSVRSFLGLEVHEAPPDHSTVSRTRRLIDVETHQAIFTWVLQRLAGLFRYSLRGSEVSWVRLSEEVEAVRSYLKVEAIRLGERLRSEISIAPEVAKVLVPPLVLQPLVENAVLHGVAPRKDGGRVSVEAARDASALVLSVTDDGDGPGSSPHTGSGTALVDLEKRLEMIYGGDAAFASTTGPDGGFRVTLSLPLELPG